MTRKSKVGKQRKDKFYFLAKEAGFRSRAAFKLIQLNKRFDFLQRSRVLIDLCAAPGGWLQVAKENMPVSSVIVGVDLYPIKAIPGCMTIQADITTEKCKTELHRTLQTWKADVILNDGAPNVGANWLLDAYQQAGLTLSALKLATHFLREGGWFVTKVFRSKDYNPLMWVFKQLFKKVHSTKPRASRKESAEIFVVCQSYIAPDRLDARFLDPKYVFKDLDVEILAKKNIFHPDKQKKAKALGYDDNLSFDQHLPVSIFFSKENVIELFQNATQIVFDDETISNHPLTTAEIKECCKDLQVLGRKDIRNLINWRKHVKEELDKIKKEQEEKEKLKEELKEEKKEDDDDEEDEELKAITKEINEIQEEERREEKRKKKRVSKERRKLTEKMNLKMIIKGDEGPKETEDETFQLNRITNKKELEKISNEEPDVVAHSDAESDDDNYVPKGKAVSFDDPPDHLERYETFVNSDDDYEESENSDFSEGLGLSDDDDEDKDDAKEQRQTKRQKAKKKSESDDHPLITDLSNMDKHQKKAYKSHLWFEKDAFRDVENIEDEDFELDELIAQHQSRGGVVMDGTTKLKRTKRIHGSDSDDDDLSDLEEEDDDEEEENLKRAEEMLRQQEKSPKKKQAKKVGGKDGFEIVPQEGAAEAGGVKKRKLDSQALAIGTMLITSKKIRRDVLDDAWNRYAFNDSNLPDWFVEYEKEHNKKEISVPKEYVERYDKRNVEINVRPIKKVVEAKARKKRRALKKLQGSNKKIEAMMENLEMSSKDKARQIRQLYNKAKGPKKEVAYVVSNKFSTLSKRPARPKGVKGPYKVVDPRMKKDLRGKNASLRRKGVKIPRKPKSSQKKKKK